MSTELRDAIDAQGHDFASVAGGSVERSLLVIWQEPTSRAFIKVGRLDQLPNVGYSFRYLPQAKAELSFHPLAEFPELDARYDSRSLPAFFANRVMNRQRSTYPQYRSWLGLAAEDADTPFEVLARTGGPRETDTFHVVDDLQVGPSGELVSRFFVSGVRHQAGADLLIKGLRPGAPLELRDEPGNAVNPRALLVDVADGHPVGWVPDWLVDDVHDLRATGSDLDLIVEQANPDAPDHLKLLCRLTAK